MGVVESDDLPAMQQVLQDRVKTTAPFELIAEQLRVDTIQTGEVLSGIRIKNNPQLAAFQSAVMSGLWPYLSYDEIDATMFYAPSTIAPITYTWVKNYAKKHEDPSLFHPHITAGFGKTAAFDALFPATFLAP